MYAKTNTLERTDVVYQLVPALTTRQFIMVKCGCRLNKLLCGLTEHSIRVGHSNSYDVVKIFAKEKNLVQCFLNKINTHQYNKKL